MRRREFLGGLGSATAWPLAARAQQVRRVGVLMAYGKDDLGGQAYFAAFKDEFQKLGWREDQNVHFDVGWAVPTLESIQRFATELVARQPDVILSSGTPSTIALVQRTRTIPIVFPVVVDPVGSRVVASLAKPGGNATGFINLDPNMAGKWVELIKEIAPRVTRVVMLYNPLTGPYSEIYLNPFKAAATALGLTPVAIPVSDRTELETALGAQAREQGSAIIAMPDTFMTAHREVIASLALRYRLPAVYFNRAFTQAGGLMSYGNDLADNWRRSASYVDRILKGERPADLPVQFPTKFELFINLKTAKALGIDVPLSLQERADEVIE